MTPHPHTRFRALVGLLLAALCFLGSTAVAEPGAAITGLVRDTAGNLLPGTRVRLRLGNLTATAQSDSDGVYSFSQLPVASGFSLRASHRRYDNAELGPFTIASGETLRVDFALVRAGRQPRGSIVGTVRNAAGRPLGGAQVEVLSGPTDGRVTTTRTGKFRLGGLQAGSYALSVSAHAANTAVLEGIAVGERSAEVQVELAEPDENEPGTLFGTVKDDAGHAIPGALVEIVEGASAGSTVSGDGGRYELGNLTAGTYAVRATAEGYWGNTWDHVVLAAGQEVRIDFALHSQQEPPHFGSITGLVKTAEGTPIAGAHVAVVTGPRARTAETNEEGRYTLPELIPGAYAISAAKEGFTTQRREGTVVAGETLTLNFELTHEEPQFGSISGVVKSAGGAPLAGARVIVVSGPRSRSAITNEEGRYTLAEMTSGSYVLRAGKDGYGTQDRDGTVVAGQVLTLNFELTPNAPQFGSITGLVKTADGAPIAGAHVEVVTGPRSRAAETNSEGRYTLPELLPGAYTVRASKDGYNSQAREATAVAGQALTLNFELTHIEPARGRLRGRVTNQEGAAIAGATVQVGDGPSATTNGDGNYEIEGVLAGERSVRVSKDGYQTASRTGVIIHAGETTMLDVILERETPTTGRLTGVVRDAVTHAAIAGATVQIGDGAQTTTGAEGGFEFNTVTTGERTIRVTREGYRLLVREHIVVTAGQTTRVELFLSHVE